MSSSARRRGRQAALQMLYQAEATGCSPEEATRLYWSSFADSDEEAPDPEAIEFGNAIVLGYMRAPSAVDDVIRTVSHHWRIERMTRVDRNVLRVGVWELHARSDIPRKVTLNECVELAKRFGSESSASFVNGVLDRVASDLGKA